ncbi:hypothetical protein K457DRAFT_133969 [Linnemannia elongata AG-77]|uniref:Lytic polysaccharide monooxygenase n=1 Tax=Linnemannia elongata AG-77 TaxID=1314771 RepID=A0A197K7Y4_9FUNG|nr:hypothetical protein K457DRAFT_133969 [Linnemannia elongata AG-77]
MIFPTLSKVSLAFMATSVLLILTPSAESHSYIDCFDWRFNTKTPRTWGSSDGSCHGYGRRFPADSRIPFGLLTDASPPRHYAQIGADPLPCSDGKRGREVGQDETMASPIGAAYNGKYMMQTKAKPGQQLCLRWPAKTHGSDPSAQKAYVYLSGRNPSKDPSQAEFLKNKIATLTYGACMYYAGEDLSACGGCFKLPAKLKAGNYVMQWRWELQHDFYTNCADIDVRL